VVQRDRELLDPPWLSTDEGSPRYDSLTDVQKAVWRRTRGQTRAVDSLAEWVHRLARAVAMGWISKEEADSALSRYGITR
jgi:hypothetical protein